MDPRATEQGERRALRAACPCRSPSIPGAAPGAVFTRPFVGERNRDSQGHSEGGAGFGPGSPKSCSRRYPAAKPVSQPCSLASTCPSLAAEPPGRTGLARMAPDGLSRHEGKAQIPQLDQRERLHL